MKKDKETQSLHRRGGPPPFNKGGKEKIAIGERVKAFLNRAKAGVVKYLEDVLIASGLITIVGATFRINTTAGLYCLGGVLLALGIYFAVNPLERRQNK